MSGFLFLVEASLDTEVDLTISLVVVENLNFDFVADFNDFVDVFDKGMSNFGNVN